MLAPPSASLSSCEALVTKEERLTTLTLALTLNLNPNPNPNPNQRTQPSMSTACMALPTEGGAATATSYFPVSVRHTPELPHAHTACARAQTRTRSAPGLHPVCTRFAPDLLWCAQDCGAMPTLAPR